MPNTVSIVMPGLNCSTPLSMSKSISSALVGIALDEGYIKSVNEPITNYIPELEAKGFDKITIQQTKRTPFINFSIWMTAITAIPGMGIQRKMLITISSLLLFWDNLFMSHHRKN